MIPGIIGNLGDINPLDVVGGYISRCNTKKCRKVRLQTIDANNRVSSATHYVADVDLPKLSGCNFPGNKNPITKKVTNGCKQGFQLINNKINEKKMKKKKKKSYFKFI